jgi:hypothetical protein
MAAAGRAMNLRAALVAGAIVALGAPAAAGAAPRLTSADVRVGFESATTCSVDMTLHVDEAPEVTQRIEVMDGASVDALEVAGATVASPPRDVGRTRVLVTRADAGAYTLRYTARQPPGHPWRCPLWVPTVPADGRSAAVRIAVRLPVGARAAGTMPTFAWSGEEGTATISHLPAFVRVPFAASGDPSPWNIPRVMDILSIATLVLATLAWARRQGQAPLTRR